MGSLSNFLWKTDPSAATPTRPLPPARCRPARREETHAALRLVLGANGRPADDAHVVDFLRFAVGRGINLNDLWLAERDGRIVWATLPIISPGRTMLLLSGVDYPRKAADPAPGQLVNEVCDHFGSRGVQLAQALLEPNDAGSRVLFEACGFRRMAELVYMQTAIRRRLPEPPLPAGLTWLTYGPETHDLFGHTIGRTYDQSLDCPLLNGLRDIEDIVAGHKSSGDFDPRFWFLLCTTGPTPGTVGEPVAVLLLSRMPRHDSVELVYLGLVTEARGRGLGDLLMRQALASVAALGQARLSLAVDALNAPAIRLYHRHGMQRVGSKVALMRELHPTAVQLPPIAQAPVPETPAPLAGA